MSRSNTLLVQTMKQWLTFSVVGNKWGKGYWKLNGSLLEDEKYCHEIELYISETLAKYSDIKQNVIIWEILKIELK